MLDGIISRMSRTNTKSLDPQILSFKLDQIANLLRIQKEELTNQNHLSKPTFPLHFPTTLKQYAIDLEESRKVFEYYSKLLLSDSGTDMGARCRETLHRQFKVKLEPIGIVGLITSFNYPLLLLSWKLAPALLAGNQVIVKPSDQSPHSTVKLIEKIHEMNIFDKTTLDVVTGGSDVGEAIVADPRIKKISFTGSTHVGRKIAQICGQNLRPCTLELGGKNCAVVFSDADIRIAVASIVDGAFSNMGQNCCGISRLLIHKSVYDNFLNELKHATSQLIIGNSNDIDTDIGPMIDQKAYNRITDFINSGRSDAFLGNRYWKHPSNVPNNENLIIPPTIFTHVPITHPLSQTELFGPVLCIHPPFETFEEAMQDLNSVSREIGYGLASGCFTSDPSTAARFAEITESGMVWINMWNECDPSVPFGGFGSSGLGKELGIEGYLSFTRKKSIIASR